MITAISDSAQHTTPANYQPFTTTNHQQKVILQLYFGG